MLINAVEYDRGVGIRSGPLDDLVHGHLERDGFVWVGMHDPSPAEIDDLISVFGLHPIVAEDIEKAHQRPKVERYDDWLFVVLHTALYLDTPETVEFGEIQILCGPESIVVIRRGVPAPLSSVRADLEARPVLLAAGPVAVLHAVIDHVVDSYQVVLSGLDDDVSEVELDVFAPDDSARDARLVERIYFLQREVLELHRALTPLSAAMATLRSDPTVADSPGWDTYFRDVADHLLRQADQLQTLRELIAATLSANATQVSLQQNDDMRRISAWVAIAAVPTMIAGIYGMNFDHMPELDETWGYPLVLTVMATVCAVLYRAFRRSGWL